MVINTWRCSRTPRGCFAWFLTIAEQFDCLMGVKLIHVRARDLAERCCPFLSHPWYSFTSNTWPVVSGTVGSYSPNPKEALTYLQEERQRITQRHPLLHPDLHSIACYSQSLEGPSVLQFATLACTKHTNTWEPLITSFRLCYCPLAPGSGKHTPPPSFSHWTLDNDLHYK